MARKHKTALTALFLLFFYLFPSPLSAGPPTDQIRATLNKVIAILNDPQLKTQGRKKERRKKLQQVIYPRFDFTEMAKRSLGRYWRRLTPAEREEFVHLFTDLLERSYLNNIEAYNNEKFVFVRERRDGNYAEVESRILTSKGEEFSVNYKALSVNGEWKIYDIVAENISLVNNYRSQFNRIITKFSYQELTRRIREK
ncbi:MAG: phospholipid-binding protein MlaC, partial [Candidatus Binatia bacterium]